MYLFYTVKFSKKHRTILYNIFLYRIPIIYILCAGIQNYNKPNVYWVGIF